MALKGIFNPKSRGLPRNRITKILVVTQVPLKSTYATSLALISSSSNVCALKHLHLPTMTTKHMNHDLGSQSHTCGSVLS